MGSFNSDNIDDRVVKDIHTIAATVAPLFLHDPSLESEAVAPILEALSTLNVEEFILAWPFVDKKEAKSYARSFIEGARLGVDKRAELATDYRNLFVGPAQKRAPQWGSVYTDKDGVTFGATTLQLEDWIAEQGVTVSFEASDEPEDSLGILLAILAWSCKERVDLIPDLLRLHILPWSSHFLERMEAEAKHPFYRGLAGMIRLTLEGAGDTLGLEIKVPRFYR